MQLPALNEMKFSALYVEDDDTTRNILAMTIKAHFPAIELYAAENGKAGLELYDKCNPDIVITDISMPEMNGLEMLRHIKKKEPEIKTVVLTALNDVQTALECIDLGVNQYVIKPVEHRTLFGAIEKCIDSIHMRRLVEEQHASISALNMELKARAAELEAANQELEAFGYTVSHDLKTPLTVISGYCQLIMQVSGEKLDDNCREYLSEISATVARMNELIESLLEFSKISRYDIKWECVDLSQQAAMIVQNLRRAEQSDRDIECHIDKGIEAVGDQQLLHVALDNLLGNAWKYTVKQKKGVIAFGKTEETGKPVFYIHDNGVGFDQDQAGNLFAPFKRLHSDEEFAGNGIGLATVKRIIQRHGGTIWAESRAGRGTTFFFTLH